jgi:hypothetical protein
VGGRAIGAAARTATAVRQLDCGGCGLAMIVLDEVVLTHLH